MDSSNVGISERGMTPTSTPSFTTTQTWPWLMAMMHSDESNIIKRVRPRHPMPDKPQSRCSTGHERWMGCTLETYVKTNMVNFNFKYMKGGKN